MKTESKNDTGAKAQWPPIGLPEGGLVCRKCGCRHFGVVYTRPKIGHIVRLRECRHCGRRVLTRERADS